MNFTLNCKIIEVAKLKEADKVSVKVLVGNTEELMCIAPSSQYDLLRENIGEGVKLKIRPSTTFKRVSRTEQRYVNRFNIIDVTPLKIKSSFPRLNF